MLKLYLYRYIQVRSGPKHLKFVEMSLKRQENNGIFEPTNGIGGAVFKKIFSINNILFEYLMNAVRIFGAPDFAGHHSSHHFPIYI